MEKTTLNPIQENIFSFDQRGLEDYGVKNLDEQWQIVKDYFQSLKLANPEEDLSATLETYASLLKSFIEFLPKTSKPPQDFSELQTFHVLEHLEHEKNLGLKPRTINTKLSAIRSFSSYLLSRKLLREDITVTIPRVRLIKKSTDGLVRVETQAFTKKNIKKLFDSLNPTKLNYTQYRAILAVGLYTGLRSKELRNLKWGNISYDGVIHKFRVIVKGDKELEEALHPEAVRILNEHVSFLEKAFGFKKSDDLYLFPSIHYKKNVPYSKAGFWKVIKKIVENAGIAHETGASFSTHSMRATVITNLLEDGVPLEEVRSFVGHAQADTTARYNQRRKDLAKSPAFRISL